MFIHIDILAAAGAGAGGSGGVQKFANVARQAVPRDAAVCVVRRAPHDANPAGARPRRRQDIDVDKHQPLSSSPLTSATRHAATTTH